MRICLAFRQDVRNNRPVECYPRSFLRVLRKAGHDVTPCGEGHDAPSLEGLRESAFDALIELENGRNQDGKLVFQQADYHWQIPTALWAIDPHGNPGRHQHIAPDYTHIFFAPYIKRDLYVGHGSAHWLPNATDLHWFDRESFQDIPTKFDFGFFSSKLGLARAEPMLRICKARNWTYDVREVSKTGRHKWPAFAEAKAGCTYLYNWGQRGDGPNQRVMESMAVGRPLLNDLCALDGMSQLFQDGTHFIGYQRGWDDLEDKMVWLYANPAKGAEIAEAAYQEVKARHLIAHRVNSILEVLTR